MLKCVLAPALLAIGLMGCASPIPSGPTPEEQAVLDDATCVVDWKTKRGSPEYTNCRSALMQNSNQQAALANQRAALDAQRRAAIGAALSDMSQSVKAPTVQYPIVTSPPPRQPVHCTSRGLGDTVYTDCN